MHSHFGPYRLLRRIGLGDLAEVFVAARDDSGDQLCAVKRISREMSRYHEVLELFGKEGELSALFDHPKVVDVFDVGDVGGTPYIAMEYIRGADLARLRDRIAPRRLPPGAVVRVILDVCEALAYIHDITDVSGDPLEVVHSDVTPGNILVSAAGVAKLIDFSVASSNLRKSEGTAARGTYAYMSPEQVRGQTLDRRSDVFTVGVVLWELLTGERLFRRSANYLTLAAVIEQPAPRLADMVGLGLGADACELDRIFERVLAKDREARYSDITEFAQALGSLAENLDWDTRPRHLRDSVRALLS